MSIRGRKPKPTHLKLVTGNPGKRKLNKREPKPVGNLRLPPDWLTPTQQESWSYAMANAPAGMLKRLDRGVLVVYVVAEDMHRTAVIRQARLDATAMASGEGAPLLVRTTASAAAKTEHQRAATLVQSPYLAIINRQSQVMLKAAEQLGFTPAARPRIMADAPAVAPDREEEENEFAGLRK